MKIHWQSLSQNSDKTEEMKYIVAVTHTMSTSNTDNTVGKYKRIKLVSYVYIMIQFIYVLIYITYDLNQL